MSHYPAIMSGKRHSGDKACDERVSYSSSRIRRRKCFIQYEQSCMATAAVLFFPGGEYIDCTLLRPQPRRSSATFACYAVLTSGGVRRLSFPASESRCCMVDVGESVGVWSCVENKLWDPLTHFSLSLACSPPTQASTTPLPTARRYRAASKETAY
jgi:hypothetical protein